MLDIAKIIEELVQKGGKPLPRSQLYVAQFNVAWYFVHVDADGQIQYKEITMNKEEDKKFLEQFTDLGGAGE